MGYKKISQLPTILTGISSTDKVVIVVSGTTYKTNVGGLITVGTSGTSGMGGSSGTSGLHGTFGTSGTSGSSGSSGVNSLTGTTVYSFQTTNSTDYQVQYDYAGTDFIKGVQYEINIFASNTSNGDLWSEKRLILIGGEFNVTPSNILSNETIGTPYKDSSLTSATFEPIVNTFNAGIYNIVWMANGINGTTINWKIQINSLYL